MNAFGPGCLRLCVYLCVKMLVIVYFASLLCQAFIPVFVVTCSAIEVLILKRLGLALTSLQYRNMLRYG